MFVNPAASYWSATANIGRGALPETGRAAASYWSVTSDIGRPDRVSLSDTVTEATFFNRRGIPFVQTRGDAGSAYRAQQTIADAQRLRSDSPFARKLRIGDDRPLNNQSDFLDRLRNRLALLGEQVKMLTTLDAFNPNKAISGDTSVVQAEVTIVAATGVYRVTVEQLAQSHQAASDRQSDPYAALNLSGTISINGYSITIESTDSIADIRDKINRGEDTNNNGALELRSEDINGNNQLDHFFQPAVFVGAGRYLSSFNYFEDIDADGVIDTSEDINGSRTLDGGVNQTKAEASIQDNRLVIRSLKGADEALIISDPDNALESLGFFKRGVHNEKILKTALDNAEGETFITDPKQALFTVNGVQFAANDNVIDDVIAGVVLTLKSPASGAVEIKVTKDTTTALENVEAFVSAFNGVIGQINKENLDHLPLQANIRVQDLTIALVRAASDVVTSIPGKPRSLDDLGVSSAGSARAPLDIAAIESLASPRTAQTPGNTDGGEPGLFARLSRIGIVSQDDFTLSVDRSKITGEIENNPERVFDVFNIEPDGVTRRLLGEVTLAIGQPNGVIEFQLQVIQRLKNNPDEVQRLIEQQTTQGFFESQLDRAPSLIEPVTA